MTAEQRAPPVSPPRSVGLREAFGDLRFSAPLTEITAAIVGAILNLALYFGYHVLWTQGLAGSFDWPSLALAVAAAIALFRCKVNVIYVIAACAIAGLLLRWFAPG